MMSHVDDDEPRHPSNESSTASANDHTISDAPAQGDDDPGLPASGIWLAALLRDDSPLMRCGY